MELAIDGEGRAVQLFLAMDTQWNWAGMAGHRMGLKYEVAESVAGFAGIAVEPRQRLFLDLKTIEAEVLKAQGERLARG